MNAITSLPITLAELSIQAILPSLVLVVGALFLLLVNVFARVFDISLRSVNVALSALFLAFSMLCSANLPLGSSFFSLITISGISILSQLTMEFSALVFIILFYSRQKHSTQDSQAYSAHTTTNIDKSAWVAEFYPLYLLMIAGFDIMVSSQHLLVILLGLEIGSLALVALIALSKRSLSLEASVKYFVLGVLASVFFIMGALCWYLATASFEISALQNAIINHNYLSPYAVFMGIVFMIGALGFKSSAVPFHTWMPDVYEGSNAIVAGVVSIIPKIAVFSVAISVFSVFLQSNIPLVKEVLYVIVALSITIPNIAALIQNDIKRMLAFSSIAHSGFVLACIMINTQASLLSLYLYWFLFAFSNIGAFGLLWFMQQTQSNTSAANSHNPHSRAMMSEYAISKLNGLARTAPAFAVLGGIFFISLAGIPPFGLFFGKMAVVMSAFGVDYVALGVILLLNSAIAVFYYLRPIVAMFLLPQSTATAQQVYANATPLSKILVWVMAFICCGSVFMVQYLLEFIGKYAIGAY